MTVNSQFYDRRKSDEYQGFQCNRCLKDFSSEDFIGEQERLELTWTGGYGSIWGDGFSYTTVICQLCHHDLFQSFAKDITKYNEN